MYRSPAQEVAEINTRYVTLGEVYKRSPHSLGASVGRREGSLATKATGDLIIQYLVHHPLHPLLGKQLPVFKGLWSHSDASTCWKTAQTPVASKVWGPRLFFFFWLPKSRFPSVSFTWTPRTRTYAQPRRSAAHARPSSDLSSLSPRPSAKGGSRPLRFSPAWSGPVPTGSFSPPSVSAVLVEEAGPKQSSGSSGRPPHPAIPSSGTGL